MPAATQECQRILGVDTQLYNQGMCISARYCMLAIYFNGFTYAGWYVTYTYRFICIVYKYKYIYIYIIYSFIYTNVRLQYVYMKLCISSIFLSVCLCTYLPIYLILSYPIQSHLISSTLSTHLYCHSHQHMELFPWGSDIQVREAVLIALQMIHQKPRWWVVGILVYGN